MIRGHPRNPMTTLIAVRTRIRLIRLYIVWGYPNADVGNANAKSTVYLGNTDVEEQLEAVQSSVAAKNHVRPHNARIHTTSEVLGLALLAFNQPCGLRTCV